MPNPTTTKYLTQEQLSQLILNRYEGLVPQNTWGETSYFYNPGLKLSRGTYFVTLKAKNGENDMQANSIEKMFTDLILVLTKKPF